MPGRSPTGAGRPRTFRSGGPPPLQTVDRALMVLLSFDESRTEWGVLELAEELGFDKSSAHRLLSSLANRGFLVSDPVTRRYRLGPAVWRMAALWERGGGLARLVTPILRRLATATSFTSVFAVPDGVHVRCVAAVDGGTGPLRDQPLAGELYPGHAGATSRAYFSMLPKRDRIMLFAGRPMARFSDATPADVTALEELFEQAAVDGYSYSEGEYDRDTTALSVPVMAGRRPLASVSLASRMPATRANHLACLDDLKAAADELSGMLTLRRENPPARQR